jgi:hypothetical protein
MVIGYPIKIARIQEMSGILSTFNPFSKSQD